MTRDGADLTERPPGAAGIIATWRELPRHTRFALVGVFINALGLYLQAYMVLYLVYRGFTEADAGVALGAYAAGAIAGTLVGGWCSDRFGTRLTIALSVAGASLMTLAVTVVPNLPTVLLTVFLAGALTLLSRPAVTALLLRAVPQARQVLVQAMYRTALNSGAIAGPVLAALLSQVHWNLVFYVDAATAMAFAGIALATFPRDRPQRPPAVTGGNPPTDPSREAPAGGFLSMLRDTRYLGFLVVMLLNGAVHIQQFAVLPVMLDGAGYRPIVYGTALMVGAVIVVACELPINRFVQHWPIWVIVLAGWLLLVAGRGSLGLFPWAGLVAVYVAMVLGALGPAVGGAAAFAHPVRVAPPEAAGRYIGAAHSMFQIGYTLGPIVGVALWLQLGNAFWGIVAGLGLLTVPLLIWSMRQPAGARRQEGEA